MYINRLLLLVVGALLIFFPAIESWIISSETAWYRPYQFWLLVVAALTKESPLNLLPLVSSSFELNGITYVPMLAYLRMVCEMWKSSPVSNVIGRSLCFMI